MRKTAITLGDPNGISPEITIKALNTLNYSENNIILIANSNILDFYKNQYSLFLNKQYEIIEIPFKKENIFPGCETKEAGEFAFQAILKACELAKTKQIESIVTAPISKYSLQLAGHNYSGQTEILQNYIAHNNQKAEMLFVCNNFSLLLLTRHLALKEVPNKIKKEIIEEKIEHLQNALKIQLGKTNIKMAICALNPHAGENGLFGTEEIKEIIPAVENLKKKNINIEGPFPSDALFQNLNSQNPKYNCYIAMYHDQGLIPLKLLDRNNCVNTTIGLDILRTSPAHGTAFDIAGKNIANPQSMIKAISLAVNF